MNLILPSHIKASSICIEVARILTETDGQEVKDKHNKIFDTVLDFKPIKNSLNDYIKKSDKPFAEIFKEVFESESIADVVSLERNRPRWTLMVLGAKIPKQFYEQTDPRQSLNLVGDSRGLKLSMELNRKQHYVYGDSRVYSGTTKVGAGVVNLCYVLVYKDANRYN